MAKLNANTVVWRPDTLQAVALAAGEDVPDWADGLVGAHLLAQEEKPKRSPARKTAASKGDDGEE